MNLTKAILQLFPNADPTRDFIVQDDADEKGPYIAQWNLPQAQPTEAELTAAWELVETLPTPPTDKERIDFLEAVINEILMGGV